MTGLSVSMDVDIVKLFSKKDKNPVNPSIAPGMNQSQNAGQFRRHGQESRVVIRSALIHVGRIEMERNCCDLEAEPRKQEDDGKPSGTNKLTRAAQQSRVNHVDRSRACRAVKETQTEQQDCRGENAQVEILGSRFTAFDCTAAEEQDNVRRD